MSVYMTEEECYLADKLGAGVSDFVSVILKISKLVKLEQTLTAAVTPSQ